MYEETKTKKETGKGNRSSEIIIILLAILLLASLSLIIVNKYVLVNGSTVGPQFIIPEANGEVFDGSLPSDNPDEVLALLQEKVNEGQFAFRINANPYFSADCKSGNLRIENPARNIYCMKAELILDETGEILYSSPLIKPNQYIEYIPLSRQLSIGDYPATVRFVAIHSETGAYMGEVAAAITLSVSK